MGSAALATTWTNADPADNFWTTPGNWGSGLPSAGVNAQIDNPDVNGPLITDGMDAQCERLKGPGYSIPPGCELTITGGSLTFHRYWRLGFGGATGTVNMSGGTIPNKCNYAVYMSDGGTLNLSGGEVKSGLWIPSELDANSAACCTLNMTGGTVNAKAEEIPDSREITIGTKGAGYGLVNLHGGTIVTETFAIGSRGQMDITEGTLYVDNDVTGTIEGYVNDGYITAYAGTGLVLYSFDDVNNTTVVSAVPTSPIAYRPSPAHRATDVCPDVELQWRSGDYAAWHDVYFGTDFNDVNDATTSVNLDVYMQRQSVDDVNYDPAGLLDWSTTYYWRVDEVNDVCAPYLWKGKVWSFAVASGKAYGPGPADLEWRIPVDSNLTWEPGCLATLHDVYLGTDYNDVSAATTLTSSLYKGRYADTGYDPGTLVHDTLYYWRIDEVGPTTFVTGDVWTFETIGAGQTLLMCDVSAGEATLKEGWTLFTKYAGYPEPDAGDYGDDDGALTWTDVHRPDGQPTPIDVTMDVGATGNLGGRSWGGEPLGKDYFFANDQGDSPDADFIISFDDLLPGTYRLATFHNNTWYGYGGEDIADVAVSGDVSYASLLTPLPVQQSNSAISGAETVTIRYKPSSGAVFLNGFILEFFPPDTRYAYWPTPRSGARNVQPDVALDWWLGVYAAAHDVYFDTDWDDVNNADTTTPVVYKGRQSIDANTYDPSGLLDLETVYYWRIDEINDSNIDSPWKGDVWRFTTANHRIVDDMEDYDDDAAMPQNMINEVWLDGWWNYTGSTVYLEYGEGGTIHGGDKAMWVEYNNNWGPGVKNYSQVQANTATDNAYGKHLGFGKNWVEGGVKALTLFFHGDPNNDIEPLYVALEDTPRDIYVSNYGDYSGDLSDITEAEWHQWDIPLSDFSDNLVDTTDVNQILIGLGDPQNPVPGGSGNMYFDDIRLYLPKCVPWLDKPDYDFSDNCIVDLADVGVMAGQWLRSDINVAPVTPPNDPVLYYKFDETSGTQIADYGSQATYAGTFFTDVNQTPAEISTRIDPGRYQKSFHFSAELGYGGIMIPAAMWTENSFSHQITVATWIKNAHPGEDPDSGAFMWEFREWDGISLTGGNRVLAVSVSDGDTYGFQDSSESASYDHDWDSATEWTHYAFVRDDSNLAVYVNGLIEAMDDSNASPMVAPGLLYLGISADRAPDNTEGLHDGFTGNLDDFKVFNYALSEPEVGHVASDGFGVILMESAVNIYDKETAGSRAVNFRDYAELLTAWLEEVLWP
jgi:hypothetical protein